MNVVPSVTKPTGGWRDEIWSHFMREEIDLFAYLPDGGLDFLIRRLHAEIPDRAVMLTTEEEGVGVCCGFHSGATKVPGSVGTAKSAERSGATSEAV